MPLRRERIEEELSVPELEGLRAFLAGFALDEGDWPQLREFEDIVVNAAIQRHVRRRTRRDRVATSDAFKSAAAAFGLTTEAVSGRYYRFQKRRDRIRKSICASVRDRGAGGGTL